MRPFGKHQQWRVSLHARARGFHLRLRASKVLPSWGYGAEARFSVVVRIRSFLLKMRSGRGTFGSRLLRLVTGILRRGSRPRRRPGSEVLEAEEKPEVHCWPGIGRFHPLALRPPEKKGVSFPFQEPTKGLLGSLAFLSHSASHRDHGGVIIHAAVSFFYLILLFKASLARRARSPAALAALVASLGVFSLSYLHFMGQISEATWMVCFNFLTFTSLLPLSQCQVVLSKIPLPIGRSFRFCWVIAVGFLFLFYELHPRRSFEVLKMMADGSTTWIPHILLIYHTFSHALEDPRDPKRLAILISLLYFLVIDIILICSFELRRSTMETYFAFIKRL